MLAVHRGAARLASPAYPAPDSLIVAVEPARQIRNREVSGALGFLESGRESDHLGAGPNKASRSLFKPSVIGFPAAIPKAGPLG